MVGKIYTTYADNAETLVEVGQEHDIGLEELMQANPHIDDPWELNSYDKLTIPALFILPSASKKGIVINLAEMRLYYYPPNEVQTYPIGIGIEGWGTPITTATVVEKVKNPTWHVPESIRAASAAEGKPLPKIIRPGPRNPLGKYALKLSASGYLIHGTLTAHSIGQRSSHGCMRLWDKDIQALFEEVPIGTSVRIIHEPFKVALDGNTVYLESHEPLSDHRQDANSQLIAIARAISQLTRDNPFELNWEKTQQVAQEASGIPTMIGTVL
jgi:L,D-transpeptidase ErfK/SrfK